MDARISFYYRRIQQFLRNCQFDRASQACKDVMTELPGMGSFWKDTFTSGYCRCLSEICIRTKETDLYFGISSWVLNRLDQPDCMICFLQQAKCALKCRLHFDRSKVFNQLARFEDCAREATLAIQCDPNSHLAVIARLRRFWANTTIGQRTEAKRDLDELVELQTSGRCSAADLESARAFWKISVGEGNTKSLDSYHRCIAKNGGNTSIRFDSRMSSTANAGRFLARLEDHFEAALKFGQFFFNESFNRNVVPEICAARKYADALVHLAFEADEDEVFPTLHSEEPAWQSVLRVSDTMKNPFFLSEVQKQELALHRSLTILDRTDEFFPDSGFLIVYHLVTECEISPPSLFRWVVARGQVVHRDRRPITTTSKELSILIDFIPSLMLSGKVRIEDMGFQLLACQQLYDLLLGGLEGLFSNERHIIFVPDRHLFRVPFACLMNPRKEFLIENHSISVSSSLRMMSENEQQSVLSTGSPDRSCALVCGRTCEDPVETDVVELVRCLEDLHEYVGEIGVLVQARFTPENLQRSCSSLRPRIMHVIAHGSTATSKTVKVDDAHGSSAATKTVKVDDILDQFRVHGEMGASNGSTIHARDVAWNYDLSGTDLVFLNSCHVGYGQLLKTGVLGFNHACFQAGCPSVISSMWEVTVEISTAFSKSFYRHYLREKRDKAESLRMAILDFLRRFRFVTKDGVQYRTRENPVFWGSYQLFGSRD